MKLCWDNIENLRYNPKTGLFRKSEKDNPKEGDTYVYQNACSKCGEPYLAVSRKHIATTCGRSCYNTGRKRTNFDQSGKSNPFWKGGVRAKNVPLYDTFAPQLIPIEEVRPIEVEGLKLLQVKCYNHACGTWFIPTKVMAASRTAYIKGTVTDYSANFYCSEQCKQTCNVYKQQKFRKNERPYEKYKHATSTDLNTWSKKVLTRHDRTCEICGKKATIAHHIQPKSTHPEFCLDPDNGMAVCLKCHQKLHSGICSSIALHDQRSC